MAENSPPPSPEANDASRIEASRLCRRCGYELRGLAENGVCPECSLPIAQSTRRDETLASAEPAWLAKLRLGSWLIVVGIICTLAMVVISVIVSMLGGFIAGSGDPRANASASASLMLINTMATIVLSLLMVIGAWLITERDPGAAQDDTGLHARLVARIGLLISVVTSPWSMYLTQSMGSVTTPGQQATGGTTLTVLAVLGIVLSIIAAVGWGAYCLHLSRLMLRVPNRALSVHCRFLMWFYPIAIGLFSSSGMIFVLILPHFMPGGQMSPPILTMVIIASAGSCIGGVGYFIAHVWMVVVHWILARRLGVMLRGAS